MPHIMWSIVKLCSHSLLSTLNCLISRSCKLYDKRDDFDFHIVNFPFLSSNITSSPSYGVYISQLIRYARYCSYYDHFGYRHKRLVDRLLSQGYEVKHLRNSFKNFYGRYPDLIWKYQRSVKDMVQSWKLICRLFFLSPLPPYTMLADLCRSCSVQPTFDLGGGG